MRHWRPILLAFVLASMVPLAAWGWAVERTVDDRIQRAEWWPEIGWRITTANVGTDAALETNADIDAMGDEPWPHGTSTVCEGQLWWTDADGRLVRGMGATQHAIEPDPHWLAAPSAQVIGCAGTSVVAVSAHGTLILLDDDGTSRFVPLELEPGLGIAWRNWHSLSQGPGQSEAPIAHVGRWTGERGIIALSGDPAGSNLYRQFDLAGRSVGELTVAETLSDGSWITRVGDGSTGAVLAWTGELALVSVRLNGTEHATGAFEAVIWRPDTGEVSRWGELDQSVLEHWVPSDDAPATRRGAVSLLSGRPLAAPVTPWAAETDASGWAVSNGTLIRFERTTQPPAVGAIRLQVMRDQVSFMTPFEVLSVVAAIVVIGAPLAGTFVAVVRLGESDDEIVAEQTAAVALGYHEDS